ncbi:unnamed protein product [Amoebophrya sp. A25]|nr:unnamed protein product [Amoebophrya sp. A25]|eukprot:GSA25T00023693001.1
MRNCNRERSGTTGCIGNAFLFGLIRLWLAVFVSLSTVRGRGQTVTTPGKHATYFAFSGTDDAMRELSLSLYSLCRLDPSVQVLVLTDQKNSDAAAAGGIVSQTAEACWGREAMAEQLSTFVANSTEVRSFFSAHGYTKLGEHHSGVGGYAKMIAARLIPDSVDRTVLLDTDTILNANFENLWSQFSDFNPTQVLTATHMPGDGLCVRDGNRIQSGVVLMDLKRMRELGWVDFVMRQSRGCRDCVKSDVMTCGDQEFTSFGCQQRRGACGNLRPMSHYDFCMQEYWPGGHGPELWQSSRNATVYHFNCRGRMSECPGHECLAAPGHLLEKPRPPVIAQAGGAALSDDEAEAASIHGRTFWSVQSRDRQAGKGSGINERHKLA